MHYVSDHRRRMTAMRRAQGIRGRLRYHRTTGANTTRPQSAAADEGLWKDSFDSVPSHGNRQVISTWAVAETTDAPRITDDQQYLHADAPVGDWRPAARPFFG
jgi:hypothetical protein